MNHLKLFFDAAKEATTKKHEDLAYELRNTKSLFIWEQMRFKTLKVLEKPTTIFVFNLVEFYNIYVNKCNDENTSPLSSNEIARQIYQQEYFIGYVRGVKSRFNNKMGSGYAIDVAKYNASIKKSPNYKKQELSNTTYLEALNGSGKNEPTYLDFIGEHTDADDMCRYGMYLKGGNIHSVNDEGRHVVFPIAAKDILKFLLKKDL